MAKRKSGGLKLRQEGFKVPKKGKKTHEKGHEKAPWSDPLKELNRGGFGR